MQKNDAKLGYQCKLILGQGINNILYTIIEGNRVVKIVLGYGEVGLWSGYQMKHLLLVDTLFTTFELTQPMECNFTISYNSLQCGIISKKTSI